MTGRNVSRFVEGLLRGRPTAPARPDADEAGQMRTAVELRAARLGSEHPREEFVTDLQRRLAAALAEPADPHTSGRAGTTRRQVVVGTGLAAASAAAGLVVGRALSTGGPPPAPAQAGGLLEPNDGTWRPVAGEIADGQTVGFDIGSVRGFVHRAGPQLQAVSGVCTHQGCALSLDDAAAQLRCPCHLTSFALDGATLTHQLPTPPPPLPKLQVRQTPAAVEVFLPAEPA